VRPLYQPTPQFGTIAMTRIVRTITALLICASTCFGEEAIDYDKAIADYDEAIRLDPADAAGYRNRAAAWLGKFDHRLLTGKRHPHPGEASHLTANLGISTPFNRRPSSVLSDLRL
jgi:tetratricopeptide (TPR) repeat protein